MQGQTHLHFLYLHFSSYSIFVLPGYPVFPLTFHFGHDGLGDFTLAHDRAWAVLIRRSREPCRGAAAAFGGTTPTSRPPLISSNRVNQKSMQERDLSCAEKVDRHHLVLHPVVVAVVVAAAGPGCHTQPHSCSRWRRVVSNLSYVFPNWETSLQLQSQVYHSFSRRNIKNAFHLSAQ